MTTLGCWCAPRAAGPSGWRPVGPPSPTKVTLTAQGDLDPTARFFTAGDPARLVYCATGALEKTQERLGRLATVIDAGEPVDPGWLLTDLAARGVQRLMVEGGGTVHAQFLAAGLADELHLVVAPFFVGDGRAPRFVGEGRFPWHPGRRARLAEARQIGDVVLLRYALSDPAPPTPPGTLIGLAGSHRDPPTDSVRASGGGPGE